MNQEEFVQLSRLLDEAQQILDAEAEIEREPGALEQAERERLERPRRLCSRCQRKARSSAKPSGAGLPITTRRGYR
jgi:hypothetical protein